ncbi:Palladin like protein [Argiope bruennichi]|uniref:Palladin like protein n=1 Tax=Argiope bruennichi TaxID=94029 RepID=A0A8T0ERP4_ARGBR|nr:Palladin like protein [Argiope bruennichi]
MLVPLICALIIHTVAAQSGHPEFDPTMEQVVLEEGTLAKVECEAKGEQPLTYKWYNQTGVEIPSDANQDIFTRRSDSGCSLIFGSVKRIHAGLYSCSATNKHGTASKPYDIIVNSTSGNITTNETAQIDSVKVINITDNSVEFIVTTTGEPDSFYIRYKEKLDKEEKSVQIKRGEKGF